MFAAKIRKKEGSSTSFAANIRLQMHRDKVSLSNLHSTHKEMLPQETIDLTRDDSFVESELSDESNDVGGEGAGRKRLRTEESSTASTELIHHSSASSPAVIMKFTVIGNPIPKARPRRGRGKQMYNPKSARSAPFSQAVIDNAPESPSNRPISVRIDFFLNSRKASRRLDVQKRREHGAWHLSKPGECFDAAGLNCVLFACHVFFL